MDMGAAADREARAWEGANEPECPLMAGAFAANVAQGQGPLAALLRSQALYPVFQPIANLRDGVVFGHEALIRGPRDSALHGAEALLQAAQKEDLLYTFECFCLSHALRHWGRTGQPGRIFLNISANALVRLVQTGGAAFFTQCLREMGVRPRMVVLEITEHERVADMQELAEVVRQLQVKGLGLALDDFGDGRSSLRLWSQIKPEFVKIDKYFSRGVSAHADNTKTLQALKQIAEVFGTELIAEGLEDDEDLRAIRDLGLPLGQGYFIGRPDEAVVADILPQARQVLMDSRVAVLAEQRYAPRRGHLRHLSLIHAPTVTQETSNDEVAAIFLERPDLHALAVVDDAVPVAIINRQQFMDHYATLYFREVFGKRACFQHANKAPRLIERDHDVNELVGILTSQDQRYLTDGFIVTDNGRYLGLGTGDQLVRSVTEMRLEAARHANPLTFLPGNIPISMHLERLIKSGAEFVACYLDMNHFKPFNDEYGYWRGDEMIRLLARLAVEHSDPRLDFVGHVGGDDFMIIYQSQDWRDSCTRIVGEFATRARELFDATAQQRGGIEAEDRHGVRRFFPLTTLSVGAVVVECRGCRSAEDIASQAAMAKRKAKLSGDGLFVMHLPAALCD